MTKKVNKQIVKYVKTAVIAVLDGIKVVKMHINLWRMRKADEKRMRRTIYSPQEHVQVQDENKKS